MVYEDEQGKVLSITFVIILLIIPVAYVVVNAYQLPIQKSENVTRYSRYLTPFTSKELNWKGGDGWGCSYMKLSWNSDEVFKEIRHDKGGIVLQFPNHSEWTSDVVKWKPGPWKDEVFNSGYLKKRIENCLAFSFGRKPDIRKVVASRVDWVRNASFSTSTKIFAISNELKTLERFSTWHD